MDENLNILAPFKDSFKVKYKKELHKNLPDFHSGVLMLLIGQPGAGKTTIILNILGRFLKYYFEEVHFIGAAFKYDQTLMPLISYYGNCHESCSDTVFNNIIQNSVFGKQLLRLNGLHARKNKSKSKTPKRPTLLNPNISI